jgi:predicted transposase YbfD/YdcC
VVSEQIKYYVSSLVLSADEMCRIVRAHWQIENNLHWVLDVTFHEDRSTGHKGYTMENLSLVRKMC